MPSQGAGPVPGVCLCSCFHCRRLKRAFGQHNWLLVMFKAVMQQASRALHDAVKAAHLKWCESAVSGSHSVP